MAEVERVVFDFKEIVTALLKKEGVHEGIWMLYVEFGLVAVNAPVTPEDAPEQYSMENPLDHLMPTAILPIKKIGIQRTDRLSSLSVDAATVNPAPAKAVIAGKPLVGKKKAAKR